jgi:hypothetical protein
VVAVGRGLAGAPTSIVVGTGAAWEVCAGSDGEAVTMVAAGWVSETASTGVLSAGRFVAGGAPHAVAAITRTRIAVWRMLVDTRMSLTLQCGLTPLGAPRKQGKGARS